MSLLRMGYIVIKHDDKSLTTFSVAKIWKGVRTKKRFDEIRMVYDTTKLKLNDAVWSPWFAIPTVDCHLREVDAGTFMVNYDVEEMLLNSMLEPFL